MKHILSLLTGLSLLFLISCTGGETNNDWSSVKNATSFVNMMNDGMPWYANGSYIVKNGTEQANYIVVYDDLLNEYVAYSLSNYSTWMDWNDYEWNMGGDSFIVYRAGTDQYGHQAWVGNNGYGDVYFEDISNQTKDLEKLAAVKEIADIHSISTHLQSAEFGLSEKSATDIATTLHEWNRLTAAGEEMTDADANEAAKVLMGEDVSIDRFKNALTDKFAGNDDSMKTVLKDMADFHKISTEHMGQIITNVLAN